MAGKDKGGLPDRVEVESNHNTTAKAEPVGVAFLAERPDYNPMRREPNKANIASDTTNTAETANDVINEKGKRPYRGDVEFEAKTIADTSAAPDSVKARAVEISREAAAQPVANREHLPEGVEPADSSDDQITQG